MEKILIDGEYVNSDIVYDYDGLIFLYDCIYDRIHVYKNNEYIDYFDILDGEKDISREDFEERCFSYTFAVSNK